MDNAMHDYGPVGRMKMGWTYHAALPKENLRDLIVRHQDASFLVGFEPDEIDAALEALEDAPRYISGCSNVDEQGRCQGHPPEKD